MACCGQKLKFDFASGKSAAPTVPNSVPPSPIPQKSKPIPKAQTVSAPTTIKTESQSSSNLYLDGPVVCSTCNKPAKRKLQYDTTLRRYIPVIVCEECTE